MLIGISFAGVALVSFSDTKAIPPVDVIPELPVHVKRLWQSTAVFGDALALLSAFFYAVYVVLLKYRIKEESRIDMQLFFGFVGLFNVITLWPIGIILHISGVEPWTLPPSRRAWTVVLLNVSGVSVHSGGMRLILLSDAYHAF